MTFYWWSHWFWVTLLSNILLFNVCVHSNPSHDISTDYNSNNNNSNEKNAKTSITKLHHAAAATTTTTATLMPPSRRVMQEVVGRTKTRLRHVARTPAAAAATAAVGKDYKENVVTKDEAVERSANDHEVKRSADENEMNNGTNEKRAESETAITKEEQAAERRANGAEDEWSSLDQTIEGSKVSVEGRNLSVGNATNRNNKTEPQAAASSWVPSQPQIENDSRATVERLESKQRPTHGHQQADDDEDGGDSLAGRKVAFTLENVNKEEEILRAESEHRARKSKVLSAEYNHVSRFINFSTDSKNLLARSAAASASNQFDSDDDGNISSEAMAIKRNAYFLDASAISAICFTAFGICCTVATLGVLLYRRRFLNKPQTLSEPDSSVYMDDSTIRDNSDEMYSLDNDSFLNSLEAMTIQNYWTDTVKHTKL